MVLILGTIVHSGILLLCCDFESSHRLHYVFGTGANRLRRIRNILQVKSRARNSNYSKARTKFSLLYSVLPIDVGGKYAAFLQSLVTFSMSITYFINPLIQGLLITNHVRSVRFCILRTVFFNSKILFFSDFGGMEFIFFVD